MLLKTKTWALCLTAAVMLLGSCSKNAEPNEIEPVKLDAVQNVSIPITVSGVGSMNLSLKHFPDGHNESTESAETKALIEYSKNHPELALLINDDGSLSVFENQEALYQFKRPNGNIGLRCSSDLTKNVSVKLYRHANFVDMIASRTNAFNLSMVTIGANDQLSSVKVENPRREYDYNVIFYEHVNQYGTPYGRSINLWCEKCSDGASVINMGNYQYVAATLFGWTVVTGNFNDVTSAVRGNFVP